MSSRRSKKTDISQKTKWDVWERDGHRCIFCGSPEAMPNAHVIPRSRGGLGVEQNIVTACIYCHYEMDMTTKRQQYIDGAVQYLKTIYPDWSEEKYIYRKI